MKKQKNTMRKGFTLVELLVVIAIIAVLAGLATPAILKAQKAAAKAQATNNAKEIGTALLDFVEQYGGYPSEDTKQQLVDEGAEVIPEGNDANAYLGQLLASGSVDSEKIFYVKGVKGAREGDSIFSSPEKMLAKGENGFGYVMLEGDEPLHSPGSTVPIIVAPLSKGGSDPVFDPKPFAEQYIYLTPDGAVSGGKISKEGVPIAKGRGKGGLFGGGKDSVFGEDIPDVKEPRGL
ncbi:MAG: type II secretion system protein [Akkermansiaceae bacterium]